MSKLQELYAEIEQLKRQAEQARREEIADVVQAIRAQVEEYGLTPDDIFGKKVVRPQSPHFGITVNPKYRNPETGETWTGRGSAPKWISGKNKDDFLIAKAA